jgi:hypothetical protein
MSTIKKLIEKKIGKTLMETSKEELICGINELSEEVILRSYLQRTMPSHSKMKITKKNRLPYRE